MESDNNKITSFKIKCIEIEIFKSVLVMFLSASLAVIGYVGLNWLELDYNMRALTIIALVFLSSLDILIVRILWKAMIYLRKGSCDV